MSDIPAAVRRLKTDWSAPRSAIHKGRKVPVPLRCAFAAPADEVEVGRLADKQHLPLSLLEFWRSSDGASLFEDEEFGQWGLRIFSASEALVRTGRLWSERPKDCEFGDFVIGEFIGDSDLLIVRCDPSSPDYGTVIVALPLDVRSDWDVVDPDFEIFLASYERTHGEKFWKRRDQ